MADYVRDAVSVLVNSLVSYGLPVIPVGPIVGHYIAPKSHRLPVDVVNIVIYLDALLSRVVPGGVVR